MRVEPSIAVIEGNGMYDIPLVRESRFKENIAALARSGTTPDGSHAATLILEPGVSEQKKVRVDIEGRTVGYLNGDVAPTVITSLGRLGFRAAIAGAKVLSNSGDLPGSDGVGVQLDASLPIVINRHVVPTHRSAANGKSKAFFQLYRAKSLLAAVAVCLSLGAAAYWGITSFKQKAVVVDVLSSHFSAVSETRLEGWLADTIRIDWRPAATRLDVILIMDTIEKSKPMMYDAGIRYFKYPNSYGTYDVVDWKTGRKTITDEEAKKYFR
jgi:hypothetical protein